MSSAPSPEHPRHLHAEATGRAKSTTSHALLIQFDSWKGECLLLVCSIVQFGLFICLAWWARKHPVDAPDVALTHVMQKQRPGWMQAAIQGLSGIAVTLGSGVAVVGDEHELVVVATSSGKTLFTYKEKGKIAFFYGAASISAGVLYAANMDGILFAFGS